MGTAASPRQSLGNLKRCCLLAVKTEKREKQLENNHNTKNNYII